MEGPNIIGLSDVTGGGAISLEPGGQFELSGAPRRDHPPDLRRADGASRAAARGRRAARHRLPRPRHDADLDARRGPGDAQGPLPHHDGLHAEGRQARPRHDVPDLHRAGQSRLLLRSRHGEEAAGLARAAAGRRPRCSPIRRSPKGSRTATCRSAPRSGATPIPTAPACCRSRSSRAWDTSATPTTRSTCRCISSSAATATSTSPAARSAICWPARLPELPGERATVSDWANHLSTIFPEVRLKRYLEMRGADAGPWRVLPSLSAFGSACSTTTPASMPPVTSSRPWSARGTPAPARRGPAPRLRGDDPRPRPADRSPKETLALSRAGLKRRNRLDRLRRATRRATSSRSTSSSSAAAPRRRSCWRNSTARGAARSTRCSRNTRLVVGCHCERSEAISPRLRMTAWRRLLRRSARLAMTPTATPPPRASPTDCPATR